MMDCFVYIEAMHVSTAVKPVAVAGCKSKLPVVIVHDRDIIMIMHFMDITVDNLAHLPSGHR